MSAEQFQLHEERMKQIERLQQEVAQARAWACALWETLTPEWRERIIAARREIPNWLLPGELEL